MPNPAGFYSFVVPRPPGTNCKARRSVSISTSIHLTKDAAEISNKVSCRLLYELRFFVMINYDFQKTAVYKNCDSFGLHQFIKVFVSCKEKEKTRNFSRQQSYGNHIKLLINLLCAFTYMLCTKLHASSSKHSFHDYGVCSKLLKVHKM